MVTNDEIKRMILDDSINGNHVITYEAYRKENEKMPIFNFVTAIYEDAYLVSEMKSSNENKAVETHYDTLRRLSRYE